jgi:hypothetical protein
VSTRTRRVVLAFSTALLVGALFAVAALAVDNASFKMVRSESARAQGEDCLERAYATVNIRSVGDNQTMDVTLHRMPPNTGFTLFVLQRPDGPFGVSWYQGDIDTDATGTGSVRVKGIFSEEVFAIAPGSVGAPQVDAQDARRNPAFAPVHTFHLGAWFAKPAQAAAAGCSDTVTPFDGDHRAGIQALSTRQFSNNQGPLRQIQ